MLGVACRTLAVRVCTVGPVSRMPPLEERIKHPGGTESKMMQVKTGLLFSLLLIIS